MSIMEKYSIDEKNAVIAFLNMMITSDLEVKIEELNLVWMLAQCVHVSISDVEKMSDETFKNIILNLSQEKLIEVLRMGYTLMNVDFKQKGQEKKLMKYFSLIKEMDVQAYKQFYTSLNKISDLTPLDQIVLVLLAHYIVEADGIVYEEELQMLAVLSNMMGIDLQEIPIFKIPKEALYHAVFSMSASAVSRIVEELLVVAISDFKISEQEYDILLPIINHFHFDFEDMVKKARSRLAEHVEYYELFRIQTEVN